MYVRSLLMVTTNDVGCHSHVRSKPLTSPNGLADSAGALNDDHFNDRVHQQGLLSHLRFLTLSHPGAGH